MKNRNAYMAVVGAMMLCGLGVTACEPVGGRETSGAELEFVCYDDGALVERHVGVVYAHRRWVSVAWKIEYKDGQGAWYQQSFGETCQVEEMPRL